MWGNLRVCRGSATVLVISWCALACIAQTTPTVAPSTSPTCTGYATPDPQPDCAIFLSTIGCVSTVLDVCPQTCGACTSPPSGSPTAEPSLTPTAPTGTPTAPPTASPTAVPTPADESPSLSGSGEEDGSSFYPPTESDAVTTSVPSTLPPTSSTVSAIPTSAPTPTRVTCQTVVVLIDESGSVSQADLQSVTSQVASTSYQWLDSSAQSNTSVSVEIRSFSTNVHTRVRSTSQPHKLAVGAWSIPRAPGSMLPGATGRALNQTANEVHTVYQTTPKSCCVCLCRHTLVCDLTQFSVRFLKEKTIS